MGILHIMTDASRDRSLTPWLKRIAAGSLLVVAPMLWYGLNSESSSYPDGPADLELYVCEIDGTVFEVTPRERYEASRSTGLLPLGFAVCPACKEPTARRARRIDGRAVPIPRDDFEKRLPPGDPGS